MKLCDDSIERNAGQQRAYRLFFWALITYSVALCLSLALLRHYHAWPGRPVFMVLPLIGVILILRSMMLYFSAADEMQRRILSEASAYTLAATIFLTVVFGFFEGTLVPAIPWWLRFTFMMSIWGFAVSFAQAKYR